MFANIEETIYKAIFEWYICTTTRCTDMVNKSYMMVFVCFTQEKQLFKNYLFLSSSCILQQTLHLKGLDKFFYKAYH